MIQILPRYAQNPWVNAAPGFLQNLVLTKVAQNFRAKEAEIERERADAAEVRALKTKGYRELEGQNVKPTVSVGGRNKKTHLVAPKTGIDTMAVGEATMPVQTMTPYGEESQVVGMGSPVKPTTAKTKAPKAITFRVNHPKTGKPVYANYLYENGKMVFKGYGDRFKQDKAGAGGSLGASRQIQAVQDHLTEIRNRYKLGKVDIFAMISLPAAERKKWYAEQTKEITTRISNPRDRAMYKRRLKQLSSLVSQTAGTPPMIQGTEEDAIYYLQQGGSREEAIRLAAEDGIILQ